MHIIPKVCKLCYCSTLKVKINDKEKFPALLGLFCEVDIQGVLTPPSRRKIRLKYPKYDGWDFFLKKSEIDGWNPEVDG